MSKIREKQHGLILAGGVLTLPMLFLIGYMTYFFITREQAVYPQEAETLSVEVYSDSSKNYQLSGKSIVSLEKSQENLIHYKYLLRPGSLFPYAGVRVASTGKAFNGSAYDFVKFSFDSTTSKSLRLSLKTRVPSDNKSISAEKYRPFLQNFYLGRNATTILLPFSGCETPAPWYRKNGVKETGFNATSFREIVSIGLESGDLAPVGIGEEVRIKSIVLVKSWTPLISFVILILVLYIILLIIALILRVKSTRPPVITYEKIDVQNHIDEECFAVVNTISENYSNADFNLAMMSKIAGISGPKISSTIRDNFDMTFKEYLNNVRITEVKRLLCESDLQINEIYWKVGYQSRTNFHRVFKTFEGISPQQYRQKHKSE